MGWNRNGFNKIIINSTRINTNVKYTKLYPAHVLVVSCALPAVNAGCQALWAPRLQQNRDGYNKQESGPQEQKGVWDPPGVAAVEKKGPSLARFSVHSESDVYGLEHFCWPAWVSFPGFAPQL